jgi:single-stranded-DNA-specific exonuclease
MSLRGLQWRISNSVGEKDFFSHLLKKRNIKCVSELSRPIFSLWPNRDEFPEIWDGVELLYRLREEEIAVVGDYDVDGTSSTAIISKYFSQVGIKFTYYIPNRFLEGYGLSSDIVERILKTNAKLVITLDNGTNSVQEVNKLKDHGIYSIIIDHHLIHDKAPADVLINPVNLIDKPYNKICATALTFIFLCELNRTLYARGFIEKKINMKEYLDIVALATVCDVMPVTGINRCFINMGIEKLKNSPNKLFAKLISLRKQIINNKNIGFTIGPYLNAAGRMKEGSIAVEAMRDYSDEITMQIISLNAKRKKEEKKVLQEAVGFNNELNGICAVGEEWHEGVIGIVAGRLKEQFNKATIVLTANKNLYKGSIRSARGFHCGDFVECAKKEGLILGGGGHEMAGGVSVSKEKIDSFRDFFYQYCQEKCFTKKNVLDIDCVLSLSAVNRETFEILNKLQPFGIGNPEPLFLFTNCIITNYFCTDDHCFFHVSQWKTRIHFKVFFISRTSFLSLRKIGQKVNLVASIIDAGERIEIEVIDAQII